MKDAFRVVIDGLAYWAYPDKGIVLRAAAGGDGTDLTKKLDEVTEQIETKRTAAQAAWQEFDEARGQFAQAGGEANRTDSDEFQKMDDIHKRYSTAAEELKDLEATRDGIFRAMGKQAPASERPDRSKPESREGDREALVDELVNHPPALGDRIEQSAGYQDLVQSGVLQSANAKFDAHLATIERGELKAALLTGTSDTSGGAFITAERKAYVPQPRRMRRILDLITLGETNSDSVEYARQTAFTNVAAETAEAASTTTGTKPEATIAFEKVTEAVKTIAHWIPATRRSLSDVAQLRTLVESQLLYGLEYRAESQVIAGDGTGENITGILNTAGIGTQAKGADSVADAIHKAITQCRLAFVEPNGVALHPNDWQGIRLSRDDAGSIAGTGGYLFGPPSQVGAQQIWGLDAAVTPSMTENTGLVGDWTKAILWLREAAQVLASDSHSDFFVKNLVVLLAEFRAAFGVLLPAGFTKVTGI